MDIFLIPFFAFLASGLTLFSGFGLGTIMVPVFALFYPIEVAVAATAIVHLLNNLFKVALIGKYARRDVVLKFGIVAAFAAIPGALALTWLVDMGGTIAVTINETRLETSPLKMLIGFLIALFAMADLVPKFRNLAFPPRLLPVGGILSGFFGGLSGNQGALRSAFLVKLDLSKEQFIGSGTVIAVMVDIVRLTLYGGSFFLADIGSFESADILTLALAILAAFLGAYIGVRLIGKTTMGSIRTLVGIMMALVGMSLFLGLI